MKQPSSPLTQPLFCPQIFSVIHRKFLPGIKNPCWYEEYSGNITLDPYRTNMYDRRAKRLRTQELQDNFKKHLVHQDGKMYRMRCLPYFYIIGQPKCGTTDLYARLKLHPEVLFSTIKEPHWWTRRRFGECENCLFQCKSYTVFLCVCSSELRPSGYRALLCLPAILTDKLTL